MVTLIKKMIWVGLGAAQQAKEVVDKLTQKGEASQSETARRIKGFVETGRRVEGECQKKIENVCARLARSFQIPSWADIERLEKKLTDLSDRIREGEKGRG